MFQLPPPSTPELFEQMVCDLFNALYKTHAFNLYGRKGQKQKGVDVYSSKHRIAIQCKQRTVLLFNDTAKHKLFNEVVEDVESLNKSDIVFDEFIIATTLPEDIKLSNTLRTFSMRIGIELYYWSWNKISNYIEAFPDIINKYYATRNKRVELARLIIDGNSSYKQSESNQYVYYHCDSKFLTALPIFDISFINNTNETVLFNSIELFARHLMVAIGGLPKQATGLLKVLVKYKMPVEFGIDLCDYGTTKLNLKSPIQVAPATPFRIQIQLLKVFTGLSKVYFKFNFNSQVIISPEMIFNSDGKEGTKIEFLG